MTSRAKVTSADALASMAGIGQAIDRAIGRASVRDLGLPTIQVVARSEDIARNGGETSPGPQREKRLIDLAPPAAESASPSSPVETAPPKKNLPPLPELKPLRKEAQSIEEAIRQATKARELAGVDGDIREGVRAIEEVGRSFDRMNNPLTDGVREYEPRGFWTRAGIARTIGWAAGLIAERIAKGSGNKVSTGTAAGVFGLLSVFDEFNPDPFTMGEISQRTIRDLGRVGRAGAQFGN
jgi:hypothetical protein